MNPRPIPSHKWKFFRSGGLEQVSLESGADLLALGDLDQELWVALSCPVKGLELDEKTLALIDTDADGRIGVPEVLAAIRWSAERLNDVGELLRGADALPIASISSATPEGRVLAASARQILAGVGKKEAAAIGVGDACDTGKILSAHPLNGDGIILPESSDDPAVQALIKDIVACMGATLRPSGSAGVTAAKVDAFDAEIAAFVSWNEKSASKEIAVLGEATDAACQAIRAVRAKVDEFFIGCRLAAFDPRAGAALNRGEADFAALAAKEARLAIAELATFPLARIEAGRSLPLSEGVNPAWAAALDTLAAAAVAPIFGSGKTTLTESEWKTLNGTFAPYETWLGGKAGGSVEKLGLPRLKEIVGGAGRAGLVALIEKDKLLKPEFGAISDVERLTRYYRDLRTLLHNFVNFADFYSRDREASFQAGTLFLDSRSTELCLRVDGPNPLAAMSKAYTVYCACTRAGGGATMTIAACFTQGDSDYVFVGRNGVFYDRQGRLWYAVVTSILDNPISIRQAFWSPYKKFLRMIEEQIAKRAAAADAEATSKLSAVAEKGAAVDKAPVEPKRFDLALITGIGVAIGSIGGFLTAVFTKFVEVPGWQLPLILVGLMLIISLPAMLIAALKLRQRTLGPILEGNGWAINGRVKINIPFGAALTRLATLPPGAERLLEDPYEDKEAARAKRRALALFVMVLALSTAFWVRWDHNRRGHYFWETKPAPEAAK